jgi:hypothetical protein
LRPLFEALAGNRTLRTLDCSGNSISSKWARDVVLPAVRANASRRKLDFRREFGQLAITDDAIPELAEAEELVAARQ